MVTVKKKTASSKLTGVFVVDVKNLQLSQKQLTAIAQALQDTMQQELAKLDDAESLRGGPLGGGIAGYMA